MFWRANFCSTRRRAQTKFIALGVLLVCGLFYLKYKSLQDSSNAAARHQQLGYRHTPRLNALVEGPGGPDGNNVSTADESGGGGGSANASHFERQIAADLRKQQAQLGDDGHEVVLTGEAKKRGAAQMLAIALNEEVSEQLRYNRTLPDVRNPLCQKVEYDPGTLPTVSVVIIFHNEPYSVLLRTVHSVMANSDARVLREIILVDDYSDEERLLGRLDYYVRTRLPADLVKIVRLKSR